MFTRAICTQPASLFVPTEERHLAILGPGGPDTPIVFHAADGPVFFDGSCFFGDTIFARAGYTALQLNPDFLILKRVYGNVPLPLPQEAGIAENCVAFAVIEHSLVGSTGIVAVGDCLSALRAIDSGASI